jgi:Zn-dependent M28 family amino/carboxypeptidase
VTEPTLVVTLKRTTLYVVKRRKFRILRSGVKVNAEWIYIYSIDWTALFAAQNPRAWWVLMETA